MFVNLTPVISLFIIFFYIGVLDFCIFYFWLFYYLLIIFIFLYYAWPTWVAVLKTEIFILHKYVWYYYNYYCIFFCNSFDIEWGLLPQIFVIKCTSCPLLRANNTLTLIYSCKRHFCLPFNKATLLVTLPFLVIPLSRMFSFFEDAGGLKAVFTFLSCRKGII